MVLRRPVKRTVSHERRIRVRGLCTRCRRIPRVSSPRPGKHLTRATRVASTRSGVSRRRAAPHDGTVQVPGTSPRKWLPAGMSFRGDKSGRRDFARRAGRRGGRNSGEPSVLSQSSLRLRVSAVLRDCRRRAGRMTRIGQERYIPACAKVAEGKVVGSYVWQREGRPGRELVVIVGRVTN